MRTRTLLVGAVAWWAGSIGAARADDPPADPADPPAAADAPDVDDVDDAADVDEVAGKVAAASAAVDGATAGIPDLDKIRAPDSPAFLLLGVSPAEIQRPTTPRELSVALGSFVSTGSPVVPESLAVEVAPYWLFSHPGLTGDELARSSWGQMLARNFTASLGTTTRAATGGTADESATDLALGLRSRILDGRRRVSCWGPVEAAAQSLVVQQGNAIKAATRSVPTPRFEVPPDGASDEERRAIEKRNAKLAEAFAATIDVARARSLDELAGPRARLAELAARCVEVSAARKGLVGDAALAGSLRFPGGRFGDGDWLAAGGWVTLAWQGEHHDFITLLRALADNADGDADLVVDAGGRYLYARGRYALSAEVIYRRLGDDVEDRNLMRVALATDMRLYGSVWLTATFGRDFAVADAGQVFALANLKWGLGGPTIELPGQ